MGRDIGQTQIQRKLAILKKESARVGLRIYLNKIKDPKSACSICFLSLYERAGIRTPDNLIKSQVLYRLSYTPVP